MQIRAADSGCGDFDQSIVRVLEFGERKLFDGYLEGFYGNEVSPSLLSHPHWWPMGVDWGVDWGKNGHLDR
jgi:hypothetical protein